MSAKILECDLGNTLCKWRVIDGATVSRRGVSAPGDGFSGLPDVGGFSRIKIASVASRAERDGLLDRLRGGVTPEFASSQPESGGVRNAYGENYAALGVDRWLAVVAAYQLVRGAALVLDLGSAITADVVSGAGLHLGGYIVPGTRLMKAALLQHTGGVRFDAEADVGTVEFGVSTEAAVSNGIAAVRLGICLVAMQQASYRLGSEFSVVVTGGDGENVVGSLPVSALWEPDLVLEGLRWVLP